MIAYSRKLLLFIADALLINIAVYGALLVRFEGVVPQNFIQIYLRSFMAITAICLIIYYIFGLYRSLWQYASINELLQIFLATLMSMAAAFAFGTVFSLRLPRSVYIISWLLSFLMIGTLRLSYRILRRIRHFHGLHNAARKRVMIIGAGEAGAMVIKELQYHSELKSDPVVIVDDSRLKQRASLNGVPVKGGRDRIKELAEQYDIDEIIVAIPSASRRQISEILQICKETKCRLKTLPGVYELIDGKVTIKQIRDVSIEDILGREEVKLDTEKIAGYLKDETILITGGGGSIGSELCRQIAVFGPKKLIIFDIYENNAYELQNELMHTYQSKLDFEIVIGSIRDKERLREVFRKYSPGVVFHAAAHKHVPLMEDNPAEAVKNNVFGTLNVAQCADEFGVKKFVLISTDKAVNPTNIMGATKRLAEMLVQSMNKVSRTEYAAVRFGNVLESNGSVIPIFKKQIEQGGPVTVTHPEIIRYFMTIPEAAKLVVQAGAMAQGGEIFVLDMGEPVKIIDLARDLIRLSGFEPDIDIKIEYTGLRPGEKLYEELLLAEEGINKTIHEKIYVGKPSDISFGQVMDSIKLLENCLDDDVKVRENMCCIVPTYRVYREAAAADKSSS